jgi:hypothetical protein
MDPTQLPPSFSPSLYERIVSWSGWEKMYERRAGVATVLACSVLLIFGFGWILSRYQSSSVETIIACDDSTAIFRMKEDIENPDYQKLLQHMESSTPQKGVCAQRFSGVILQEQILQSLRPSNVRAEVTQSVLTNATLNEYGELLQISLLSINGKHEEAVRSIDALLSQPALPENLHFYLLVQKAELLSKLHRSADTVLEELQKLAVSNPSFEQCFPNGVAHFLKYMQNSAQQAA